MTTHKHKRKTYKFSNREQAEARAREARAHGHEAHVRYDNSTGRWIVDIIFLGLALGLVGTLFRN